jgi:hypothetical protein
MQAKPSMRCTRGRREGKNLAGVRGWEGVEPGAAVGTNRFTHILGSPGIPEHFLFLSTFC